MPMLWYVNLSHQFWCILLGKSTANLSGEPEGVKIHRNYFMSVMKRPRLERFHCENTVPADFGATFQNLLQHLSGEPECVKIHRKCNRSALKRPRLERFHCENIVRAHFGVTFQNLLQHLSGESDHCENTVHEEGRGGGGGGGEGEELAVRKKNKNPTQRMWGIN